MGGSFTSPFAVTVRCFGRSWTTRRTCRGPMRRRRGARWTTARPGPTQIPGSAPSSQAEPTWRAEVERVRGAPSDEPSFRAYDLNENLSPTREMIFSPDDLRGCFVDEPPPRRGPCALGFDFGEAVSATTACAIWPATGRVETWMGFGDNPDVAKRGRRDDADYRTMVARGELVLYPGRVVKVEDFLSDVAADLERRARGGRPPPTPTRTANARTR